MEFTLFTDWGGDHSSQYFWFRGALFGFVLASYLWCWAIPRIKMFFEKRS